MCKLDITRALIGWNRVLDQSTDVQSNGVTPQPVCEMPGLLSRFFCFFFCLINYPDVLYNLENENELLASMDIDHPQCNNTNNTVIESGVSEEVSD